MKLIALAESCWTRVALVCRSALAVGALGLVAVSADANVVGYGKVKSTTNNVIDWGELEAVKR